MTVYNKKPKSQGEPLFTRGDVAKILNVTPLTISNREKAEKYPEPKRDINNYRIYTLNDVLNLQLITFGELDTRPVLSLLYDKGWTDARQLGQIMDKALSRRENS